jgi:hypothetical protein
MVAEYSDLVPEDWRQRMVHLIVAVLLLGSLPALGLAALLWGCDSRMSPGPDTRCPPVGDW